MEAVEFVTSNLSGPFIRYKGCDDTVRDNRNQVFINFLLAGRRFGKNSTVMFPLPRSVSDVPLFVTLEQLVALKLDSWVNSPLRRLKDKAGVIELVICLTLPRDLLVDETVLHL